MDETAPLQDSVKMFVILDRDYRSDEECKDVVRRLAEIHVTAHIWSKKELENYLLLPNVIARVSDVGSEQVASLLTAVRTTSADSRGEYVQRLDEEGAIGR